MTDIAQDHLAHVEAALREHRELEKRTESLLTLSEAWGQDRPDRSALLRGARILSRIAHDLVCHFIWEECDGYMGAVLRHDPSRYDEVDRMRRDHERMNHTMKSIHDDAVLAGYGGPVDVAALPLRMGALIQSLQDHEARERTLIQECLCAKACIGH